MHQRSDAPEQVSPCLAGKFDIEQRRPPQLDARVHALFLDIDGTLAPIVAEPELAQVSPSARNLLIRLAMTLDGALAFLTGRSIADAERMLGGAANIAGCHGLELKQGAKTVRRHADLGALAGARREARIRLQHAGVQIEDKSVSFAIHFRQNPAAEHEVRAHAQELAAKHALQLIEGKMVIELLAGNANKAEALETFLAEPPFAGRTPIAIGDDITDESAFAAAHARGGFAILVGPPRPSAAQYRLADPAAVETWLAAAIDGTP